MRILVKRLFKQLEMVEDIHRKCYNVTMKKS